MTESDTVDLPSRLYNENRQIWAIISTLTEHARRIDVLSAQLRDSPKPRKHPAPKHPKPPAQPEGDYEDDGWQDQAQAEDR